MPTPANPNRPTEGISITDQRKLLKIAETHLGLSTLAARNSDDLDFKEQAVWSIRAALEAAFLAGKASK